MIYGSKHGKYWFSYIFHCNFTTMVSTEVKLWFLSSLEHFWPYPWDTLSEVALFFEKMHKVFKNKAQGCSTPLKRTFRKYWNFQVHAYKVLQVPVKQGEMYIVWDKIEKGIYKKEILIFPLDLTHAGVRTCVATPLNRFNKFGYLCYDLKFQTVFIRGTVQEAASGSSFTPLRLVFIISIILFIGLISKQENKPPTDELGSLPRDQFTCLRCITRFGHQVKSKPWSQVILFRDNPLHAFLAVFDDTKAPFPFYRFLQKLVTCYKR